MSDVIRPRRFQHGIDMVLNERPQRAKDSGQLLTLLREGVLYRHRHRRRNIPRHEPTLLEMPKGPGQRLSRRATDFLLQLPVALPASQAEIDDDEDGPLVCQAAQQVMAATGQLEDVGRQGTGHLGSQ